MRIDAEKRRSYVGASDVPIIMGLSPWKTAYDLWAEKTGLIEPAEPNEHMQLGTYLEDAVFRMANDAIGPLTRRGTERRVKGTPILVHLDAIKEGTGEPVEMKTSGILSHYRGDWGDGDDEIPEYIIVQVQTQILAVKPSGIERAYVAALVGGLGFRLYTVWHNETIEKAIRHYVEKFWKCVETQTPPDWVGPSFEVWKALKPGSSRGITTVSGELIRRLDELREAKRRLEKEEEEVRSQLIQQLGQYEYGMPDDDDTHLAVRVSRSVVTSVNTQKVKQLFSPEDRPDLYMTSERYFLRLVDKSKVVKVID